MKPGAIDHPKIVALARRLRELGVPQSFPAQAIGHLEALWTWAWMKTDDGDLSSFEVADIAAAARWRGDPQTFIDILADARLLDRGRGYLRLHDAADHRPGWVGKRLWERANPGRKRRQETDSDTDTESESGTGHDTARGDSADVSPDDSAEPCRRALASGIGSGSGSADPSPSAQARKPRRRKPAPTAYTAAFEDFWNRWPAQSRVGKREASDVFERLDEADRQRALEALAAQSARGAQLDPETPHGSDGRSRLPHPRTWLNQRRFEDAATASAPAAGRKASGARFEGLDYGGST